MQKRHDPGAPTESKRDEPARVDDNADLLAQLKKSQMQLETLKDALAVIEQETSIAREKIDTLSEIETFLMEENSFLTKKNSLLRSELAQLARKASGAEQSTFHNELTGLPNRRLLLDRLKQAIALASRQHKRVALLFLHVDDFKAIRDKLGPAGGDQLVQALAQRLNENLRGADTVCHFGEDEFIVMLPEVDGPESADAVEQKIRARLAQPYLVEGNNVAVAFSVRRAMYPAEREKSSDVQQPPNNVSILPRKHDRK